MHYHFVSADEFAVLVADGAFIEHATFAGQRYGTTVAAVRAVTAGHNRRACILDIEMEGVKQVRRSGLPARFVFVCPPTFAVLEARLRARGTEDNASLRRRLQQAEEELKYANTSGVHDYMVVNEDREVAYQQLENWVLDVVRAGA